MYLPDVPSHVIQRGNNRDVCFYADPDYQFYLACLKDAASRYKVAVHAYVLMTNHTHLLMTPEDEQGISCVMQSLGRRYVQYINKTYRRTGTLWGSRHKASVVDAEDYLLHCYRYIELNPVRAGMVEHPGDYRWSSYRYHAYGEQNDLIQDHLLYHHIAADNDTRRACYRELFSAGLDRQLLHEIRTAAIFSMPLGNDRFKLQIERALDKSIGYARRGRSQKAEEEIVN